MLKQSSETRFLQGQFQDINTRLMSVVSRLTLMGNPIVSGAIQDIALVSQSIHSLEQTVTDELKLGRGQLEALMKTGKDINSSLGRKQVLEKVMDSLIDLMRAERGFLMLRDQNGELCPEIARGVEHIDLISSAFMFSSTVVRRVADTGEPVRTTNAQEDPDYKDEASVAAYQLRSILCAPLKLNDVLIGVIYVDNRIRTGLFQESDLKLISAFADQAAVAIYKADLIDELQATNSKLMKAYQDLEDTYQRTLEGWVRAVDLRDKETEGHTQRVIILTERLARSMDVEDNELINITRGALLHDIGKMGIPDSILLKKGELTPEERAHMQKHPDYAHEMLWDIKFLRPAVDIPYCHHEKWDGSGYPRRLKGTEIPFSARVFAVIDVWDALVSDRPYRKGMPPEEVKAYIMEQSEKHFDPNVVRAFLDLDDLSV